MAINDRVVIGAGSIKVALDVNVPVYELEKQQDGTLQLSPDQVGFPKVAGGVKGGSTGKIIGHPVNVYTAALVREKQSGGFGGKDVTPLFPVSLDGYGGRVGWFPTEHMRIVG